jgi:hypothetical protein
MLIAFIFSNLVWAVICVKIIKAYHDDLKRIIYAYTPIEAPPAKTKEPGKVSYVDEKRESELNAVPIKVTYADR